jgi:hypothetical protein
MAVRAGRSFVPSAEKLSRKPSRRGAADSAPVRSVLSRLWPAESRFESWALIALCALAIGRIYFGAATLPFFADTDEQFHYDLVHKFARGHWPALYIEYWDPETVETVIFHHSPEFQAGPEEFDDGRIPPPLREMPTGPKRNMYAAFLRYQLSQQPNHEAHSPPVYYALAGAWYDVGWLMGFSGPNAVYWVRFFNVPVFAALVIAAFAFCRQLLGRDIALAVAALTALFPNNVFFTVNSDVLSPLTALLAILLALRWCQSAQPSTRLGVGAGLLAATAVLVKLTNAAVLVVVGFAILVRLLRDRRPVDCLRETWPLVLATSVPLILWGLRNRLELGDCTGTATKVTQLTWTVKPWREVLDHPIFTAEGAKTYFVKLTANFFDGDANWYKHAARSPVADTFILVTSAVFPVIAVLATAWHGRGNWQSRLATILSAVAVVAFLGVLIVLSMRFDFGDCPFPSREFPFFTSGRLISGAMVPFLTLYVCGIHTLVGRWPVLFALAVTTSAVFLVLAQMPFLSMATHSQYNWFHLR